MVVSNSVIGIFSRPSAYIAVFYDILTRCRFMYRDVSLSHILVDENIASMSFA